MKNQGNLLIQVLAASIASVTTEARIHMNCCEIFHFPTP